MQHHTVTELDGAAGGRISEHARLDAVTLQCADDPIAGADLDDVNVSPRFEAIMFRR